MDPDGNKSYDFSGYPRIIATLCTAYALLYPNKFIHLWSVAQSVDPSVRLSVTSYFSSVTFH